MSESSLRHHMKRSHNIVLPNNRGVDVRGEGLETYVVSFLRILKLVECPVEVCTARKDTPERLREHFMYRHWKAKLAILQEGPHCHRGVISTICTYHKIGCLRIGIRISATRRLRGILYG